MDDFPTYYMVSPQVAESLLRYLDRGGPLPALHRDTRMDGHATVTYLRMAQEEVADSEWKLVEMT